MWNLQKATTCKKSTALDVEPVYTFRGHAGPVLSLEVGGHTGEYIVWNTLVAGVWGKILKIKPHGKSEGRISPPPG